MPDFAPVRAPQDPAATTTQADQAYAARKSAEDDAALVASVQASHPELRPRPQATPTYVPGTTTVGGKPADESMAPILTPQTDVQGKPLPPGVPGPAQEALQNPAIDPTMMIGGGVAGGLEGGAAAGLKAAGQSAIAMEVQDAASKATGLATNNPYAKAIVGIAAPIVMSILAKRGISAAGGAAEEPALPQGTVLDVSGKPVTSAPTDEAAAEPSRPEGPETSTSGLYADTDTHMYDASGKEIPLPEGAQQKLNDAILNAPVSNEFRTLIGNKQFTDGGHYDIPEGATTKEVVRSYPELAPLLGIKNAQTEGIAARDASAAVAGKPTALSKAEIDAMSAASQAATPQSAAQTLAEKQIEALKTARVGERVATEFGKPEIATTVPESLTMQEANDLKLNLDHFYNQGVQKPTLAAHTAALAKVYQAESQGLHDAATDIIQRSNAGEDVTTDLAALNNRFSAFATNSAQLLGARSEMGRSLQILDPLKPGNIQVTETAKLAQQLGQGDNQRQLAEMLARLDPDQLPRTARNMAEQVSTGRALYNGLIEYYKDNLLSNGARTASRVASANTISGLLSLPTRAVASMMPGSPVQYGEPLAGLQGFADGFWHSVDVATESARTGNAVFTNEDPNAFQPNHAAISGEAFGLAPDSITGKALDYLGNLLRLPTRGLTAAHQFTYSMMTSSEGHMLAWRQAVTDAQAEGLDGIKGYNRATELYHQTLNDMPADLTAAARQAGATASFINQIEGKYPQAAETLAKMPGLNLIMPFFRVAYNVKKWGLDYTPGIGAATQYGDFAQGGAPAAIAGGKQALSILMAAMVTHEVMQGRITGDGPPPGAARDALMAQGWEPNSFKIGDRYIQIPEPLSTPFGIVANYAELSGQLPQADLTQKAAMVLHATAQALSNDSIVQGLSQVKQLANDAETNGFNPAFERFIGNIGSGFVPYSALMKAIVHSYDTPRKPTTALQTIEAGIPKWSENVPIYRDVYGKPVVRMPGVPENLLFPVNVTKARPDEVDTEIAKIGPTFERIPQWLAGRAQRVLDDPNNPDIGVNLTLEQQDKWAVMRGDGLHEQLQTLIRSPAYQAQSDLEKKQLIEFVGAKYSEIATMKLLQSDPALRMAYIDRQRAKVLALRPPGATPAIAPAAAEGGP